MIRYLYLILDEANSCTHRCRGWFFNVEESMPPSLVTTTSSSSMDAISTVVSGTTCAPPCLPAHFYFTNRGFDLLASLKKCNQLYTWNKNTKQIAFLIISSTPSLKNISQSSSHSFWPKLAYFHHLPYFYLGRKSNHLRPSTSMSESTMIGS